MTTQQSTATKDQLIRRLKIIEGQIRGLQQSLENEEYCADIINQSLAARQALSAVEDKMLARHLTTDVPKQMRSGDEQRAVRELLELYTLSKKK